MPNPCWCRRFRSPKLCFRDDFAHRHAPSLLTSTFHFKNYVFAMCLLTDMPHPRWGRRFQCQKLHFLGVFAHSHNRALPKQYWTDIGTILDGYWHNIGRILGQYWTDIGRISNKEKSARPHYGLVLGGWAFWYFNFFSQSLTRISHACLIPKGSADLRISIHFLVIFLGHFSSHVLVIF